MSFVIDQQKKSILSGVVIIVLLWLSWQWFFCRFYVAPDRMAVITAKIGKKLPDGKILAGPKEKGIREEVLSEGRYFFNPIFYTHEIFDVIKINPGQVGIVTSKIGNDLPDGEFLADKEQKGIQKDVLGPGKYRLNPYGYHVDIFTALNIPIGYVGVVTSLSGTKAEQGKFASKGEKGVMKNVLQPGLYYINPKQYKVNVLEIGINQVSLIGGENMPGILQADVVGLSQGDRRMQSAVMSREAQAPAPAVQLYTKSNLQSANQALVGASEQRAISSFDKSKRSVRDDMGAGFSAPMAESLQEASSPVHHLDIDQFVEFPSKDGFHIQIDMTVEFELLPPFIASIYSRYGELTDVVEKIIMPQILSISRLKGSEYKAKDFIMGEGRETFQKDLTKELMKTMEEKEIKIHSALIRNVSVPMQILAPIQAASIAIEENLTNIEKQETAKKRGELNKETMLIKQNSEKVEQETRKIVAEIQATLEKEVAQIGAQTKKEVSDLERQIAIVDADKERKLGTANADVSKMIGNARSEGFHLKVQAFNDPKAYSLYEMATNLPTDMKIAIIHAGTGTLWTDIDTMVGAGDLGGMKILEMGQQGQPAQKK
jgi:hypothetical protein